MRIGGDCGPTKAPGTRWSARASAPLFKSPISALESINLDELVKRERVAKMTRAVGESERAF